MEKVHKTDEIYEIIKKRIIKLEYEPGQVLNEEDIANEFKVSRTPVRKIFQQLNADKLLNIIPRYGAQVTPIDFKHMKSVFEVTRQLDPFAAKLAVDRINKEQIDELEEILARLNSYDIHKDYKKAISDDENFHETILSSSGNPCLAELVGGLHLHTERMWHYAEQYIDNMDIFTITLGNILRAIKDKDTDKVEKYAIEHIDAFVDKVKKEML